LLTIVAAVAGLTSAAPPSIQTGAATGPRLPALTNAEAWTRLPHEEPTLPAWARVLAGPLPQTTGGMLELDYLHRAGNPLGPVLAGKLRWVAAETLGCTYAKRYAEADLRRAGMSDDDLRALAGGPARRAPADRAVLDFAAKLTRSGSSVTDEEVSALLKEFGPERLVAIVHTLAHANFQDRIFLVLGVTVEPGGPLPPLDPRLDAAKLAAMAAPERRPAAGVVVPGNAPDARRTEALGPDLARLRQAVERQKARAPRIPLPDASRFAALPPEARGQAGRIVWSAVSMGYQPQLTKAWFDCMQTFRHEANLDRVFSNCFFWVITRDLECFY
jgi:alkylhydroperoxidase family enzyme